MKLAALILPAALAGCAWFEVPANVSEHAELDLDDHLVRPRCRADTPDSDVYCLRKHQQYERHERARRRADRDRRD